MNLEDIVLEEARHRRTDSVRFHGYEVPRVVRFIETQGRRVVSVGWGRGDTELTLSEDKAAVFAK